MLSVYVSLITLQLRYLEINKLPSFAYPDSNFGEMWDNLLKMTQNKSGIFKMRGEKVYGIFFKIYSALIGSILDDSFCYVACVSNVSHRFQRRAILRIFRLKWNSYITVRLHHIMLWPLLLFIELPSQLQECLFFAPFVLF